MSLLEQLSAQLCHCSKLALWHNGCLTGASPLCPKSFLAASGAVQHDMPCPTIPQAYLKEHSQLYAPARPAAVGSDLSTTSSSAGAEMLSAAAALSKAPRTGSSACVKQPSSDAHRCDNGCYRQTTRSLCVLYMHEHFNSVEPNLPVSRHWWLCLVAMFLLSDGQLNDNSMLC